MALNNIKSLRQENGFTIVELLIVIVVIAILAAISIVSYTGIQNRAKETSAQTLASQVAKKADIYYTIKGVYPTTLADFTDAANPDFALDGAKVTFATGSVLTATPVSTNFASATETAANSLSQYNSGNRVIYIGVAGTGGGAAGGYRIHYWKAGNALGTISKGTAPTGTYTAVTNAN